MRTLTQHEKRTIRIGGALIAVYLLLFGGARVWSFLEKKRTDYAKLKGEAENLAAEIQTYQAKADSAHKLMEAFKLDPAKLNKSTAVAEASAAIQKAAAAGGIQLGAIRESPARPSNKELATIQIEATGPVPVVTALLSRLDSVGYPLVIETVQITPMPMGPGMVKLGLTIVILDFEQWKKEGVPEKVQRAQAAANLGRTNEREVPNA
jgi:hypothetical protein